MCLRSMNICIVGPCEVNLIVKNVKWQGNQPLLIKSVYFVQEHHTVQTHIIQSMIPTCCMPEKPIKNQIKPTKTALT